MKYSIKRRLMFFMLHKRFVHRLVPVRYRIEDIFRRCMGYELDLDNPKTFNEKLQWLKLYDHNPLYTKLVDKYEVKDIVAKKIGQKYIIPTLGVYNTFEEIDFNKLPNQFVLKCTHDSGSVVICKDKTTFDYDNAREVLTEGLNTNFYKRFYEWPYKNVPHRIIAEKYMQELVTDENVYDKDVPDYKIFCFNGDPKFLFVATGRQKGDTRFDFYDVDFNHLPFTNGHPNADTPPAKPVNFEKMLEIARKLSSGIPQVRVDLYEVNDNVWFGELTFFHWGGVVPFEPAEWDVKLGNLLNLNVCFSGM